MTGRFHWAGAVRMLAGAAESLGVAKEDILRHAGLTREEIPLGATRIAWPLLEKITQSALKLTAEPALGLMAGLLPHVDLGVAGTYFIHLSPVRESQRVAYEEVWPRLTNMVRQWHEESGALAFNCAAIVGQAEPFAETYLHMSVTMHVGALRAVFGKGVEIDHVSLRTTALGDPDRLSSLIGIPVLTGQAKDCLAVPRASLDRDLPLANPKLCALLRPQFEAFLQQFDADLANTTAVQAALERALAAETGTDLEAMAECLRMKPRTLQSRLVREGTSFTEVQDAARKAWAVRALAIPGVKMATVAAQVGFSDAATFTRAFRRWTGFTPKAWQQRQAENPSSEAELGDRGHGRVIPPAL